MSKMSEPTAFVSLADLYRNATLKAQKMEQLLFTLREAEAELRRVQHAFDLVMVEYQEKKHRDIPMEERGKLFISMGELTLALQKAIADLAKLRDEEAKERASLFSLQKHIAEYYTLDAE